MRDSGKRDAKRLRADTGCEYARCERIRADARFGKTRNEKIKAI
jgi:hypothetical protein